MNDASFIREAVRLVVCEPVIGELIEYIGDILKLEEGENQYDVRPGMHDFGASRGFEIIDESSDVEMFGGSIIAPVYRQRFVRAHIAEQHPADIVKRWREIVGDQYVGDQYGVATLVFMTRNAQKKIRSYIFERAQMQPLELPPDFRMRGEATLVPVSWSFQNGKILEQTDEAPRFSDPYKAAAALDAWLETL